jgi:hypothetical protein
VLISFPFYPSFFHLSPSAAVAGRCEQALFAEKTETTPQKRGSWNFVQVPISIPSPTGWDTCILLIFIDFHSRLYSFLLLSTLSFLKKTRYIPGNNWIESHFCPVSEQF